PQEGGDRLTAPSRLETGSQIRPARLLLRFAAGRLEFQKILKGRPNLSSAGSEWFRPGNSPGPLPNQGAGRHESSDPDRGGERSQRKASLLSALREGTPCPA